MTIAVPDLKLSLGQVLWCLAGGKEPSPPLPAQIRYLRDLEIPFKKKDLGKGRGVRLAYGFYELIELGVAYEGLRRRIEPRNLKKLASRRTEFRKHYREAYLELAANPGVFDGDPHDRALLIREHLVRLYDKFSETPGEIVIAVALPPKPGRKPWDLVEVYEGGEERDVIALNSLIIHLLGLAKIAPVLKPGPKS